MQFSLSSVLSVSMMWLDFAPGAARLVSTIVLDQWRKMGRPYHQEEVRDLATGSRTRCWYWDAVTPASCRNTREKYDVSLNPAA